MRAHLLLTVFSELVPGPPERGEHLRMLVGEGSRVTRVAHDIEAFLYLALAFQQPFLRFSHI